MDRDPRFDPLPGDVLRRDDVRYEVTERTPDVVRVGLVRYRLGWWRNVMPRAVVERAVDAGDAWEPS